MELTRRQFVAGTIGGIAVRATDLRLRITGSVGRQGAELGVDEMTRTAMLLGRTLHVSDADEGLTIDLDEGRFRSAGATYHVAASPAAKRAALAAWQREHGGAGHGAVEWHPDLQKFGAEQLNERFLRKFRSPMDAAAWIGWMLVKIPVEAILRGSTMVDARFDGHKGIPLVFGPDKRLIQPLCIVDKSGRLLGVVDAGPGTKGPGTKPGPGTNGRGTRDKNEGTQDQERRDQGL